MSEPEKKKNKCSLCKEVGHSKRTCPKKVAEPETKYEEVKVKQVTEQEKLYVILESGVFGFTEHLPRVTAICRTPQDVVTFTNSKITNYFEKAKEPDDKLEDFDIPYVNLETIQGLIDKKKIITQIISLIPTFYSEESEDSVIAYKLRLQVFDKGIYSDNN